MQHNISRFLNSGLVVSWLPILLEFTCTLSAEICPLVVDFDDASYHVNVGSRHTHTQKKGVKQGNLLACLIGWT